MASSKARKTPIVESKQAANPLACEHAVMTLENACLRIQESRLGSSKSADVEQLYAQQRLKNLATPISLALAEYKGPRRFHNHYRHRADDDSVLHPVLENPMDMVAHVCERALLQCQKEMLGVHDPIVARNGQRLESALRGFLRCYEEYKS